MAAQDNELRGYLVPDEKHDPDNEKSPSMKGKLTVAGVAYRLTGWTGEKEGTRFLKLQAQEPEAAPAAATTESTGKVDLPY